MRIVAGKYKGRFIKAVSGENTRPTTDRVREAWGSTIISLLSEGFTGARVLDAFAGSGALGLEALSRGAEHVVFCERDHAAQKTIGGNIAKLDGAIDKTTVLAMDAFLIRAIKDLKEYGPYRLILLDPPYSVSVADVKLLLERLIAQGSLAPGALVTYEHRKDKKNSPEGQSFVESSPAGLTMVSCKVYGSTQIDYLRYQ
jgi:16S rRNA (guanine966-N2)-methyltransferase